MFERSVSDVSFRALQEVSQGVTHMAHRHRLSQLVHHHSESEELLGFKSRLDAAFRALMVRQPRFGFSPSSF